MPFKPIRLDDIFCAKHALDNFVFFLSKNLQSFESTSCEDLTKWIFGPYPTEFDLNVMELISRKSATNITTEQYFVL